MDTTKAIYNNHLIIFIRFFNYYYYYKHKHTFKTDDSYLRHEIIKYFVTYVFGERENGIEM